ncbi:MAG: hypothetical protein IJE21_04655 [Alistipes sp.]|nr:hypothetical protein [Alistipes sp.]
MICVISRFYRFSAFTLQRYNKNKQNCNFSPHLFTNKANKSIQNETFFRQNSPSFSPKAYKRKLLHPKTVIGNHPKATQKRRKRVAKTPQKSHKSAANEWQKHHKRAAKAPQTSGKNTTKEPQKRRKRAARTPQSRP